MSYKNSHFPCSISCRRYGFLALKSGDGAIAGTFLSLKPPSQQHYLQCHQNPATFHHLHAIIQVQATFTSHPDYCRSPLTGLLHLSRPRYHLFPPQHLETFHGPLPTSGPSKGSQLMQKKAQVLTMASNLLFLLTLSPNSLPFAHSAPAPRPPCYLLECPSRASSSGLFTCHSLFLEYVSPRKLHAHSLTPSCLHPNVTSQLGRGGGAGL